MSAGFNLEAALDPPLWETTGWRERVEDWMRTPRSPVTPYWRGVDEESSRMVLVVDGDVVLARLEHVGDFWQYQVQHRLVTISGQVKKVEEAMQRCWQHVQQAFYGQSPQSPARAFIVANPTTDERCTIQP